MSLPQQAKRWKIAFHIRSSSEIFWPDAEPWSRLGPDNSHPMICKICARARNPLKIEPTQRGMLKSKYPTDSSGWDPKQRRQGLVAAFQQGWRDRSAATKQVFGDAVCTPTLSAWHSQFDTNQFLNSFSWSQFSWQIHWCLVGNCLPFIGSDPER